MNGKLEIAFEDAVFAASREIASGIYKPRQLLNMVAKAGLTYMHSGKILLEAIAEEF
ncbi:MAG: hypothetical protein N3E45_14340 [Oscillatoriaceae bacterium SKW80]|nr:hypothetical protein [Oscillatoriaceae bacterium SKYG93]MCX8121978.1 hypothetical protein [Oscillatoriaceae bacterium SKW80]MDW8454264.1 hypothetical protein [Oscillatoriaceae cyanobacterium SKYGB_i_bin93]HIK29128.1 hypothetical protein [Oscillatoriaceae cyanobacterium M7585_C2015_266]